MSDNPNLPINIKTEPGTHLDPNISAQNLEKLNIKSEPSLPVSTEPQTTLTNPTPTLSKASSTQSQPNAPAKRVFVPNLSIDRRSKADVKTEPDQNETRGKEKQPRRPVAPNLGASRGRGGRNQQNLIQSHSIFEAGPAESTKRFGGNKDSNESYSRVIGSSSSGEKTSSSFSSSVKKEPSDQRIKIEQNILIEDYKEEDRPVYVKLKHDYKDEINEGSTLKSKGQLESELKDAHILKNIFDPVDDTQNKEEKLILFQLPENLQFNELAEGHIGKIRIRRSGKIEFCVNDNKLLNVNLSVSGQFLQDAVAIEITPGSNNEADKNETGKMTNLGHVINKVVCSPKF